MPWIGRKRLAFVPLYRPHAIPPDQIPPDWAGQILRRALFDPDPQTKVDRSLRAFIHTVSSGRADLDAVVLGMQTIDQQDVPANILEGLEIVPVAHVDEVLARALAQPVVPIEWTEADELATEPAIGQIGTDPGASVARH